MDTNVKLSIVIPVYEQKGLGLTFLKRNLERIATQTYKNFEVIVSDNSTYFAADSMKGLCSKYPFVKYVKNDGAKAISPNVNNAIRNATGEYIKVLFQDDFLFHDNALQDIVDNLSGGWLVTASEHSTDGVNMIRPFYPEYNRDIYLGNNTISSPSVLTFINDGDTFFDEKLSMLMDVDMYKRLYDKYGTPTILNKINVVNGVGSHQVSYNFPPSEMEEELTYIKTKYV